jgi:hypothetical protein
MDLRTGKGAAKENTSEKGRWKIRWMVKPGPAKDNGRMQSPQAV